MKVPFWVPSLWIGLALYCWPQHLGLALVGYHGICLAGSCRRDAWTLGPIHKTDAVWPLLGAGLILLALVLPPVSWFPSMTVGSLMARWPGGLQGQAIYAVLVNAPLEEAFWRGALNRDKAGWTPLRHGLAFGLHHGLAAALLFPRSWVIPAFLVPALAGQFWTWLARRKSGIGIPILLHAFSDLSLLVLAGHQMKAAL
ncbi:MAG TPA: CPBP family glutamic-type intramembrane protease [Holophagaceae bacterium]|nr:CPBP family glutamic-type intramembrane protease [Holophagaceae bacterium]